MGGILFLLLIVLLIASIPTYPYSRDWGYYPSGGLGLLLIIVLVLLLLGVVPWWPVGPVTPVTPP